MTQIVIEPYLNISEKILKDESIEKYHYVENDLQTGSLLNHSETLRFQINNQDANWLPCESYLVIKGKFTKDDNSALADTNLVTLNNNAPMFLFSKIEYLRIAFHYMP